MITLKLKNINFYQNRSPILIKDINIDEIVVSNKLFYGKQDFKYFVGYKHFCYLINEKRKKFY